MNGGMNFGYRLVYTNCKEDSNERKIFVEDLVGLMRIMEEKAIYISGSDTHLLKSGAARRIRVVKDAKGVPIKGVDNLELIAVDEDKLSGLCLSTSLPYSYEKVVKP